MMNEVQKPFLTKPGTPSLESYRFETHFSPEDRGSMSLQNIGFSLQVHMALQSMRSAST
jgi:hypothetical protein